MTPRALLLVAADTSDPIESVRLVESALAQLRDNASRWAAARNVNEVLALATEPLPTRVVARALGLGVTEARALLSQEWAMNRVRRIGVSKGTTWTLRRVA